MFKLRKRPPWSCSCIPTNTNTLPLKAHLSNYPYKCEIIVHYQDKVGVLSILSCDHPWQWICHVVHHIINFVDFQPPTGNKLINKPRYQAKKAKNWNPFWLVYSSSCTLVKSDLWRVSSSHQERENHSTYQQDLLKQYSHGQENAQPCGTKSGPLHHWIDIDCLPPHLLFQ